MSTAVRLALAAAALATAIAATRPAADPGLRLASASRGRLVHANARDARAVLSAANMRPGQTESGIVRITNAAGKGRLSLIAGTPVDTPGPGGGRLSRGLELKIEDVTNPRHRRAVSTGHLARACHPLGEIAGHSARLYRFSATLSARAGNAYALSSARIDFTWLEAGAPGACSPAAHRARSRHRRRGGARNA